GVRQGPPAPALLPRLRDGVLVRGGSARYLASYHPPVQRSADWMDQAERDLRHAGYSMRGKFYEWACLSAQQAAEMAVKAVFQAKGAEIRGHTVADLLRALAEHDPVSEELVQGAAELDKVYIPTRYPDAHASGSPGSRYTLKEAERMIDYADRIVRFCQGLLA